MEDPSLDVMYTEMLHLKDEVVCLSGLREEVERIQTQIQNSVSKDRSQSL